MIDSFLFQYSNTFLLNDANPDSVLIGYMYIDFIQDLPLFVV